MPRPRKPRSTRKRGEKSSHFTVGEVNRYWRQVEDKDYYLRETPKCTPLATIDGDFVQETTVHNMPDGSWNEWGMKKQPGRRPIYE